jgi:hypothetical protein
VGGLKLGRRESADTQIRALAGSESILKTLVVHYSKEFMKRRVELKSWHGAMVSSVSY